MEFGYLVGKNLEENFMVHVVIENGKIYSDDIDGINKQFESKSKLFFELIRKHHDFFVKHKDEFLEFESWFIYKVKVDGIKKSCKNCWFCEEIKTGEISENKYVCGKYSVFLNEKLLNEDSDCSDWQF